MRLLNALTAIHVVSAVTVVTLGMCAAPARAQTCHSAPFRTARDSGFHVGAVQVFAIFSEDDDRGEYQGLIPTLTWSNESVTAELAVPVYRLEHAGDESIGLGDVAATARVAVFRSDAREVAFGPELVATFPTGAADDELGMGHVMAMPGAWLRVDLEPFSIMAQLAYGRALSSEDHAHHADHDEQHATPRVNPMNASEFEHALGIRYAVHPNLSFTARWIGAVPLEDSGVERQLIGPGLQLEGAPLDAALEVQVPVAGDPFDLRFSFAIGAQL